MEKLLDTQLFDLIKQYNDFGVGLHGIRNENGLHTKTAMEIFESCLKLGPSYGSINGNVREIGIIDRDNPKIDFSLQNYLWGEYQNNIIVLYPSYIENDKGEKLYLGYTESQEQGYDQDTKRSLMDVVCSELGYIPKEFIFGYYIDKEYSYGNIHYGEHITYDFIKNPNFCNGYIVSNELFDLIKDKLIESRCIDISRVCMESLEKLDIEPLDNYIRNESESIFYGPVEKLYERIYNDVKERIERKKKLNDSFSLQGQDEDIEKIVLECLQRLEELQTEEDKENERGTFKM